MRQLGAGSAQAQPPLEGNVSKELLVYRASLVLLAQPALIIVSDRLDLPMDVLSRHRHRRIIVATSERVEPVSFKRTTGTGIDVVWVGETRIDGRRPIGAMAERELAVVSSIAGPAVILALIEARVFGSGV